MDRKKEFVPQSDDIEARLKQQIVGLVDKSEFQKIRERASVEGQSEREAQQSQKKRESQKARLSFADEDEQETIPALAKRSKLTAKEEEKPIQVTEEQLSRWKEKQELIKNEKITVKYKFWNGNEVFKTRVKKRASIIEFVDSTRKDCKELKGVSTDNILCVKDDIILPQHLSFYDLIANDAQGKYGPLFANDEDLYEEKKPASSADELLKPAEEVRIVFLAERKWYERHKDLFPAVKWAPLDLNKLFKPLDLDAIRRA